jgi:hypothetical protein
VRAAELVNYCECCSVGQTWLVVRVFAGTQRDGTKGAPSVTINPTKAMPALSIGATGGSGGLATSCALRTKPRIVLAAKLTDTARDAFLY